MVTSGRLRPQARRRASRAGHTFIELLVTTLVLTIMASAVLPVAAVSRKREKELELRRALRELRMALNSYHDICRLSLRSGGGGAGAIGADGSQLTTLIIKVENDPDQTCWPKELDVLIEGSETNKPRYKLRYLRRIPKDPFNVALDERDAFGWNLRSTTDRAESNLGWDKKNVYDVHSGSEAQALDGSYYKDW